MKEISNNLLAALLVVAIAISGFGIITISNYVTRQPTGIMGAAVGTGKVNLTISEAIELTLLRNESLFGAGFPNSGGGGLLVVNSNKTDNCGTGGATCFYNGSEGNGTNYGTGTYVYPFVARVGGNDESTCLRVEATNDASGFIGGVTPSGPTFSFAGKNNESSSCYGTLANAWTTVSTGWATICNTVNHTDNNDEVRIHWQLGIPEDAAGSKSDTVTVCAAGDCGSC